MSPAPRRRWWRVGLLAGALLALVLAARALDAPAALRGAVGAIAALGAWGPAVFVPLYMIVTVLLLPAVVLTLAAGAVFGLAAAFLAVSAGATLGATASFLIARYLARDLVARRVGASARLQALDAALAREGWKIVLLTRLSPAFPFVLLNYAYGLTRVPLRHYVAASAIGMMPGIALYTYIGSLAGDVASAAAGGRARSPAEWAVYAAGLVATLAVTVYVTRIARAALDRRIAS